MPPSRPADLPDFRNPPVVEVYLSIQFEPIFGFDATLLSAIGAEFAPLFPKMRHQQPLGHDIETFGAAPAAPQAFQFQIGGLPDINVRLALTSTDDARLLQVQSDRFVHNWRRTGGEADYPRYETIREAFEVHSRRFFGIIARARLAAPVIDQCEISYINDIEVPIEMGGYTGASRVFSQLRLPTARDSLPPLEDLGIRARYIVEDDDRRPIGRLHTLANPVPGAKPDRFRFNLLTRGRPAAPTLDAALGFFDLGRRTIVRAFAALTTPEMHKIWGRADVA
jgi:uncharacterized protein (TIGR04255 family)